MNKCACGADINPGATSCAKCGQAVSVGGGAAVAPAPVSSSSAQGGLSDNAAGAIAYITIIPAILFLVMEPYNKKPFVRFHAFQCLFLAATLFAVGIVLAIIPFIGWMLLPLVQLAGLATAVFCLYKASQGTKVKLPIIGEFAEKQANS